MKFTGLNVPTELKALFGKIVSMQKNSQIINGTAQTRKSVRKKAPPKKDKQPLKASAAAAIEIVFRRINRGELLDEVTEIAAEKKRIRNNEFNPLYWLSCQIDGESNLESHPTNEPRAFINTYIYPDEMNKPSRPTYPDGTPSTLGCTYYGNTDIDTFEDKHVSWLRITFDLMGAIIKNRLEPLFVKFTGQIAMQASTRGCKPMRALTWKAWVCPWNSPRTTTLEPPMSPRRVIYPRVKAKKATAPFYQEVQEIEYSECINWSAKYVEAGEQEVAVVLVAPLPMMGKWFNNNTSIAKQWNGTVELFRIKLQYWHSRKINENMSWIYALTKTSLGFVALTETGNVSISLDGVTWQEQAETSIYPINGNRFFNIDQYAIGFSDFGLAYFDWASRKIKEFTNQPAISSNINQGNGWLFMWQGYSGDYEIWTPIGSAIGIFPFTPSSVVETSDGVIIYAGGGTIWHLSGYENYRQLNNFALPEHSINSAVIAASKCCLLAKIAGVQKLWTGADWDIMSEAQQIPQISGALLSDVTDYIEILTAKGYSIKSYDGINWSIDETGGSHAPRSIHTNGKITVAALDYGQVLQHWRPE